MKFTKLLIILVAFFTSSAAFCEEIKVGDVLQPKLGVNYSGDKIEATNYQGKVLVVTFLATWWKPGLKELSLLDVVQKKLGADNLAVVAVSYKEDKRKYSSLAKAFEGTPLVIAFDKYGKVAANYKVDNIPYTVVIGRDGKVFAVHPDNDIDNNPSNDEANEKARFTAILDSIVAAVEAGK